MTKNRDNVRNRCMTLRSNKSNDTCQFYFRHSENGLPGQVSVKVSIEHAHKEDVLETF